MDIFVSYAHADRDRIVSLVHALEGEGWTVWWDRLTPAGARYDREIEKELDAARCVIAAWTEASVESDWVLAEAGDGLDRGVLVPLLLDDVRLPLAFRRVHTVAREDLVGAVAQVLTGGQMRTRSCVATVKFGGRLRSLDEATRRVRRIARSFRGRIEDTSGDSTTLGFPSASGAMRAALEMRGDDDADLRIGIHLGVARNADDDPAMVARGLAMDSQAAGIRISDAVYQDTRRRLELATTDLGELRLPDVPDAIYTYAVGNARPRPLVGSSQPRPQQARSEDRSTLAVLPFRNMNGDPDFEYFGDGIALDVIEELLRLPRLVVISAASSFTFKKSTTGPVDVGRELSADFVLEGSVRRAANRARITAQLIRTDDASVVWGEHYDRTLENLFEVQDDITSQIATAMDFNLYMGDAVQATRTLIRTSQAREHFYRAWELLNRLTKADVAEARVLLEKAAHAEPESPLTYGFLAWTHYLDIERGWSDSNPDSVAAVERYVGEALQRGDPSGIGPMLDSHLRLLRHDYDAALSKSADAIKARPSCPGAFSMRANVLNHCGHPQEAVAPGLHALRLSPIVPSVFPEVLALSHYLNRDVEQALQSANETVSYAPDSIDARVVLAATLAETGRTDAARDVGADIFHLDPTFALARYRASHPFRDAAVLERIASALQTAGLDRDRGEQKAAHGLAPGSRRRITPQRSR